MIQYNKFVIADVGNAICKKKQPYPCFIKKEGTIEEFNERPVNDVEFDGKHLFINPVICLECPSIDKIKETFIKYIFTNDEQIAIMLNYQDSKIAKNKEIYNLMQGWRKWISEKIEEIKTKY
jgi:hypothetical protein